MLSLDKKIEIISNVFKIYSEKIFEINVDNNIYTTPLKEVVDKIPNFIQTGDVPISLKKITLELFLKLQKNSKDYEDLIEKYVEDCQITLNKDTLTITTSESCFISIFDFINKELKCMDFKKYKVEVI